MRSAITDVLPPAIKRSLEKFGDDLSLARRKRHITIQMMAERLGVSIGTYRRAEKGDPSVAFGVYVMALQVLGFGTALLSVIDASRDEHGLIFDAERVPKRVRVKREPTAL